MFVRKLKNRSGSVSIQIISKSTGKYKVVKTIGSSNTEEGINLLFHQARYELNNIHRQSSLFVSKRKRKILLNMDKEQQQLTKIIAENL